MMEDDASRFLKKIVRTIAIAILWLMVNMTFGIYFGWMFFYHSPTLGNFIFYGWMLLSLVLVIWYLYKIWKDYIT